MSAENDWTVKTAFEQLESCGYKCEAGPLEMNVAYIWLKKRHLPAAPMNAREKAIEALRECIDDLADRIEDYYKLTKDYPSEARRYERDMWVVIHAREALAALEAQEGWQRGFPAEEGWYLVHLEGGDMVVTPYKIEPRWVEADEEWDNRTGWTCLTHSRARVTHWMPLPPPPAHGGGG